MKELIDDKLFELIAHKKNFEYAYDIYEQFHSGKIKDRLLKDFLKNYKKSITESFKDAMIIKPNEEEEFTFNKKKWKYFRFFINYTIETSKNGDRIKVSFNYGVGFSYDKKKIKSIPDEIRVFFENEAFDSPVFEEGYWWINSLEEDIDLNNCSGLSKLIPESLEEDTDLNNSGLSKSTPERRYRFIDDLINVLKSFIQKYTENIDHLDEILVKEYGN